MGEKTKILVVDDEESTCEFAKSFLEDRNYRVFTALRGGDAITIVRREKPPLVLLDIKMEGMDGLEVLKRIKEIDKNIKVIMVSAFYEEDMIKEAKKLGASDYVAKPFTMDYLERVLLEKISSLARRQSQNK